MKRRFVILLDRSTPEQNKAFIEFLKTSDINGYWHWLNNSWLIATYNLEITGAQIRDKIKEIFPDVNNMVLVLNEDGTDTWAGFGPKSEDRDMFRWLRTNWKPID
jgi:hypothetical protein